MIRRVTVWIKDGIQSLLLKRCLKDLKVTIAKKPNRKSQRKGAMNGDKRSTSFHWKTSYRIVKILLMIDKISSLRDFIPHDLCSM